MQGEYSHCHEKSIFEEQPTHTHTQSAIERKKHENADSHKIHHNRISKKISIAKRI